MKFLEILEKHRPLLCEQEPGETPDAAAPDPAAAAVQPGDVTQVAPEGYVDIVRLLVKATAMNFPVGSLDELYRTDVTKENAFIIQRAVEAAVKQYETSGDNIERLNNPNYENFLNTITPRNFIERLKRVESIIKRQDPYVK